MYLPFPEFNERYLIDCYLNGGSYGLVYLTLDRKYVVKVIQGRSDEDVLISALREINVYSSLCHPCIGEMSAWTSQVVDGRFCIKLAISYGHGVNFTPLSLFEVAGDILSGIESLQSIGLSHNDLKPENLIFRRGHIQLVDFGLSTPLMSYSNGDFIVDPSQTAWYRDPEVYEDTPVVDSRADLYPVGMILVEIFDSVDYPISQYSNFNLGEDEIKLCKDLVRYPLSRRCFLKEIFEKYPKLRHSTGQINLSTEAKNSLFALPPNHLGSSARSYCLALHLARRLEINDLLISSCCLFLAHSVLHEEDIYLNDIADLCSKTSEEVREKILEIVVELKGILSTPTIWDYSGSGEMLTYAYLDFISSSYQPGFIPWYEGEDDKNLTVFDLIGSLPKDLVKERVLIRSSPVSLELQPQRLSRRDLKRLILKIEDFNNLRTYNHFDLIHITNCVLRYLPQVRNNEDIQRALKKTRIGQKLLQFHSDCDFNPDQSDGTSHDRSGETTSLSQGSEVTLE